MKDYNHKVEKIMGMRLFACKSMKHAYCCEQPFNYCPSCGYKLPNTKEADG